MKGTIAILQVEINIYLRIGQVLLTLQTSYLN